ncbi:M1 family metallopeptidase [Cohnella nanjingensis]|uniref:M1 family peptidase n=1 Tax=Cohnella nanjingensis TaxID=1387779 RepID=A0A7X0RQI1_9BACL|nr:M1 family metallopeptidase [Cohnella nanjingensis]MBB6670560.1 M1 family peptidase [Cohnella nanjingensis]
MPHRRTYRMIALAVSAAVLIGSMRFGFADAWASQFALPASAPALEESAAPQPKAQPQARPAAESEVAPPAPQPVALSNRLTEYHISVRLEDDGTLNGTQTLTWKNPGRKSVSDLYLHLYPNAFSPGSTFLSESGGQLRGVQMKPGGDGAIALTELTSEEGETLLPRVHYVQPDDGNAKDRTLATLRLPEAVRPGQTVTLKMKFTVKLPQVFARMGKAGDFVMAGQWFPKVAVYETAGTRGRTTEGWNLHQYHGNSEFYSDFGIYNVKIDVPDRDIVAATGFQTKTAVPKDGRKVYQFYADDVHDFGWAASPNFTTVEDSFSSIGVPGVRIKLYLDPLHKDMADRYMHAAKSALAKLGQWYGDYPYTTLSVVVPPGDAEGAGGMEYPTLVTAAAAKDDRPGYDLERTVVHEIAHQYWYGIVASNEFEEAWLDEGFTSYTEDKLMASIYGVMPNTSIEASYLTRPEALKLDSWKYGSSNLYAENVYMRGKLVLKAVEAKVGEQTMNKILRAYFQKYRFRHPGTADFQKVVESVTKDKWSDFFQAYVYRGEMADFAVESIETRSDDGGGLQSLVVLRRNGGSPQPVTVLFHFADGTAVRKTWDNVQNHVQLQLKHTSPLQYVSVDPMFDVVLDNYRFNNYLKTEVPEKERIRLNVGLSQLIETVLGNLAW